MREQFIKIKKIKKLCRFILIILFLLLFRGQSPAEADLNLLETARRCELYGMKMHPAKVMENN